ncbi:uncharacterized protein LOC122274420 [Carya illinoinensis]|uniref:uncharacterized protein LOC122274420 n=1 Tax=Carya illinoinensis TaxID=32201 RepID=UPI001C7228DC|nr:uncharacterized protein LOC122274420 [Carya illinoinensis]
MESLEEKWKRLRLREEEQVDINLDDDSTSELDYKEQRSLLGKICSSRIISREVLEATLAKIWRLSKAVKLTEVCSNVFVLSFETIADKERVWSGRPWLFDNQLLVLKDFEGFTPINRVKFDSGSFWMRVHDLPLSCMTKVKVAQICSSVGKVEDVEMQEDGSGWGNFLRIQVHLDLTKPIARGRTINVRGCSFWVSFTYEKLPKICFSCGCIVHGEEGCTRDMLIKEGEEQQYGSWLRAKFAQKPKVFNEGRGRREESNWWMKVEEKMSEVGSQKSKEMTKRESGWERREVAVSDKTEKVGRIEEEVEKNQSKGEKNSTEKGLQEFMGAGTENNSNGKNLAEDTECNVLVIQEGKEVEGGSTEVEKQIQKKGGWKRKARDKGKKEVVETPTVKKKKKAVMRVR